MIADQIYQKVPKKIRIKVRKIYEKARLPRMLEFHSKFINSGDLVFDIGANIGDYTYIYNHLGARVICLEPQPYCIKKLKNRFPDNPDITIVEKGVSDKKGSMLLNTDSKNHSTATFSKRFKKESPFKNRDWDKSIAVKVTTLKELVNKFGVPKYCKIDVEGYEYQVLKTLHKPIRYISFEYTVTLLDETKKCMDFLKTLGKPTFNFSTVKNSTKLILPKWTENPVEVLDAIRDYNKGKSGDIFVNFPV